MNFRFLIFDFRLVATKVRDLVSTRGPKSKIKNPKSKIPWAFTLIEVLVALSIFAMAAVVLGASYVNVLLSYETAASSTQGDEEVKFARAQLLAIADPKKIEEGGDFDSTGGRRVHWSAQIESTETADLFLVHFLCEINDPAAPDTPKIAQNFRVLRPTWSDPAERDKLRQEARQRIQELNANNGGSAASGGQPGKK
jgi:general secretion pathway protein I